MAIFRRWHPKYGKNRDFRPFFGIDDWWSFKCRQQFRPCTKLQHQTPRISESSRVEYVDEPWHRFLPRDAMHKNGLCRRAMSRLSVCKAREYVSIGVNRELLRNPFAPPGRLGSVSVVNKTTRKYSNRFPHNDCYAEGVWKK